VKSGEFLGIATGVLRSGTTTEAPSTVRESERGNNATPHPAATIAATACARGDSSRTRGANPAARHASRTKVADAGADSPETATGGPIALVEPGDRGEIDISARTLTLLVDEAVLARRREGWRRPPARYAAMVGGAEDGAVLRVWGGPEGR